HQLGHQPDDLRRPRAELQRAAAARRQRVRRLEQRSAGHGHLRSVRSEQAAVLRSDRRDLPAVRRDEHAAVPERLQAVGELSARLGHRGERRADQLRRERQQLHRAGSFARRLLDGAGERVPERPAHARGGGGADSARRRNAAAGARVQPDPAEHEVRAAMDAARSEREAHVPVPAQGDPGADRDLQRAQREYRAAGGAIVRPQPRPAPERAAGPADASRNSVQLLMRTGRRALVLGLLVAIGAMSIAVARAQQSVIDIRLEKVKDNLFLITGGRASPTQGGISGVTTVFVAATDVVIIDTKYPGFGSRILEQVKSVTARPVTMIVNTHTHGDHTGSNGELPRSVQIVAHENTKTNMARMEAFTGEKAAFLPARTF